MLLVHCLALMLSRASSRLLLSGRVHRVHLQCAILPRQAAGRRRAGGGAQASRERSRSLSHPAPVSRSSLHLPLRLLFRLSRASAGLEDSFRRRRDSRISVSGSFQTPEIDVPISQFGPSTAAAAAHGAGSRPLLASSTHLPLSDCVSEIPRVEAVRMSLDASLSERRSISKLTELFLAEVQAKIQENTQRGSTRSRSTAAALQHCR